METHGEAQRQVRDEPHGVVERTEMSHLNKLFCIFCFVFYFGETGLRRRLEVDARHLRHLFHIFYFIFLKRPA